MRQFLNLSCYRWQGVRLKCAWSGPAALQLFAHALDNAAKLPVLNVLSGTNFVADVTLGVGEVVHDYFAQGLAPVQNPSFASEPCAIYEKASAARKTWLADISAVARRYDRVALVVEGGGARGAP